MVVMVERAEGDRIPGVYEKLLAGRCMCGSPCRSDPRLGLQDLTPELRTQWEWLKAQCLWEAEQDRAARLAAGAPFEVPRWYFGGHSIPRDDSWPAWLRSPYSNVKRVRVFPDDTIAPA
jgi:hypothetical protein